MWWWSHPTLLPQPSPRTACSFHYPARVLPTVPLAKSGTNLLPYLQVGLGTLFLQHFLISLDAALERPQIFWSVLASPNSHWEQTKTFHLSQRSGKYLLRWASRALMRYYFKFMDVYSLGAFSLSTNTLERAAAHWIRQAKLCCPGMKFIDVCKRWPDAAPAVQGSQHLYSRASVLKGADQEGLSSLCLCPEDAWHDKCQFF